MNRTYYETGIETPEILGSGSQFSNIVTTKNEDEAFKFYRSGGRNYLHKIIYLPGEPRIIEWWDDEKRCWGGQ